MIHRDRTTDLSPLKRRSLFAALFLSMVLGIGPITAAAGTIHYEYYKDGTDPGTVWVRVIMEPSNPSSCTECRAPDSSQLHVSPAPIQPAPWTGSEYPNIARIQFDATGATVEGVSLERILVLNIDTNYEVSGAITRRESFGVDIEQGGGIVCLPNFRSCIDESTDYPALTIEPSTVPTESSSFSVIKALFGSSR